MTTTTQNHRLGIEVEQRGRVLLARLHGGPRGEFGPEIAADLAALVTRAETDEGVGAVVITGTHPERFVAHANLRWLQEGGAASPSVGPRGASAVVHTARATRAVAGVRKLADRTPLSGAMELLDVHETFLRMNRCGAVFIAALNGSALGIGSELALACDYRLMADGDHVIGQPEILLGFPPGGGGTQRLVRLVGTHQGLKRMLDGGGLDPEAAAEIGYVDEVVPADELIDRAVALADRLAQRLKFTVAAVKRSRLHRRLARPRGRAPRRERRVPLDARQPRRAGGDARLHEAHRGDGRPAAVRPTDLRADARSRELRTRRGSLNMTTTKPLNTGSQSTTATTTSRTAPTRTINVGGTPFAYRELGPRGGVPLVFLHHFTAVLDDWDPRVIDGIAAKRHVITFDNRGVGASGGSVPHTIDEMAADAVAFIRALGHEQVDLLGFSLGGGVAQVITLEHPELVRRVILAGTGPRGGGGIEKMPLIAGRRVHQGRADAPRPPALPLLQPQRAGQARRDGVHGPSARSAPTDRDKRISHAGQARPAQGDPRGRPGHAPRPQQDHPAGLRGQRRQRRHGRQQPLRRARRAHPQREARRSTPTPGTAASSSTTSEFVPAVLEFLESRVTARA